MLKSETIFYKKKQVILFIFNYSCQLCGLSNQNLHVHHIDHNHKNNYVFNLVPLCKDCHVLAHRVNLVLEPQTTPGQKILLQKLESNF